MNDIKVITKYKFGDSEYNSLDNIHTAITNRIGSIIDSIDHTLSPAQKLKIHDALIANRKALVSLLTVQVDIEAVNASHESLHGDMQSIFDVIRKT